MGVIRLENLKPGMITAAPVLTQRGQQIIDKNVMLTRQMIARMQFYNIIEVVIVDPKEPNPTVTEVPKTEPVKKAAPEINLSYSQKIRNDSAFQKFQIDYTNQITNFNNYLKDFKETKKLRYAQELQDIPKALISTTRTSIQFFDMLHNLRTIDDSIYAHSLNVAMISRMLGKWLKLDPEQLDILTLAAALHDVGKFLIPDEVLNKQGKLTDEEFALIKQHPSLGYDFLKDQDIDYHVKQAALMHHERCDGSGYPLGLTANEIDNFAQVIAIADVYDAMTAARKYRAPLCPFQVIEEFEKDGLTKYNPKFILTFLRHIANAYQNNRVLLNDGRSAKIILLNENHLSKPMIQLNDGSCLDLAKESGLFIQSVV